MEKELLLFGADGELGRGVTDTFLSGNFNKVYLFARNLSKIKAEVNNAVIIQTSDLSQEGNVKEVMNSVLPGRAKELFLFSTIGGFRGGRTLWETGREEWELMMNINLNISFYIAKHFASLVSKSAGGSICFTSAMSSLKAESKRASYGTSKNALNFMVQSLAQDGKEINLSANVVAPWILDTEENRSWVKEPEKLISHAEIARVVIDLFNNYRVVTGNVIALPGKVG